MKVLFVASGNSSHGISPIVRNQGESLQKAGLSVGFYAITGKGLKGYLKSISDLRKTLSANNYEIIHAHYSLSAFAASLAGSKPLVVSLMGSDVKGKTWAKLFIKLFSILFWNTCIVKSEDMKISSGIKNAYVVPNGVDLQKFRPLDKNEVLERLGWASDKRHILFPANPERPEKNFKLVKEAFELLHNSDLELHHLYGVDNDFMVDYYNASDLVLLTSLWEGSPNVIKEAMACNCPVVSTNVGDVKVDLGNMEGCHIASFEPEDVANKIKAALDFGIKTNGRQRIVELGLDSETVAKRIREYIKTLS